MHKIIYALVEGKDKEEAIEKAKKVFEGLCEGQRPYDYYQCFDEPSPYSISGDNRWGKRSPAVLVKSKEGKKLLAEVWGYTKEEMRKSFERVKEAIKDIGFDSFFDYTFHKNSTNDAVDMIGLRCECSYLGYDSHSNAFIYTEEGQLLIQKDLDYALRESGELYLVPADVHF